jgi:hypothetical protein
MRNIGQPEQFKILIEEYWERAKTVAQHEAEEAIETKLRKKIGLPVQQPRPTEGPPIGAVEEAPPEEGQPGFFANFFKVRFEENDVITYRKHWFLLLMRIGKPLTGIIACLVLVIYLLIAYPTYAAMMTLGAIGFLGFSLWWVYEYWDWRDDQYQVNDRNIVDLERRPLGREVRKSAPLESILSMEHEREGLIGILLNYGRVSINVGDTTFNFYGVHNPARVRQDISDRQQTRIRQVQIERQAGEQERMLNWLERYHRNAQEAWTPPPPEIEEPVEEDEQEF